MTRADRVLLKLWLGLTLGAAIAIVASFVIILLMFTIIGIPVAILLAFTPTIWLYVTPPLVAYAVARHFAGRTATWAASALSAVLVLTAGYLIPTLANRETNRRAAALVADDRLRDITLPHGVSVIYLVDRGLGNPDGRCWDTCQRLLFS